MAAVLVTLHAHVRAGDYSMISLQMLSSSFGRVWIADSAGLRLVMVLQLVQVAVALVASYTQFRS